MKFAIFGTGGMGAYFGGRLARAGHDVTFIARGNTLAALRAHGLRLESPTGNFTLNPVNATDDTAQIGPVNCVLYCVKLYDVNGAAHQLLPLLRADTAVLALQNGVDVADMLAPVIGRNHILPGASYVNAHITEPGFIQHRGGAGHIDFGELDGQLSPRAQIIIDAFASAGMEARFKPDIIESLWSKFVMVCGFAGIMALTRSPIGKLRDVPVTFALMGDALREALAIARASGINLPTDYDQTLLKMAQGLEPNVKASLLEDIEHGRRLEIDWFSGTIVRLGEKLGIPTPVHRVIHAALKPHVNGA